MFEFIYYECLFISIILMLILNIFMMMKMMLGLFTLFLVIVLISFFFSRLTYMHFCILDYEHHHYHKLILLNSIYRNQ